MDIDGKYVLGHVGENDEITGADSLTWDRVELILFKHQPKISNFIIGHGSSNSKFKYV